MTSKTALFALLAMWGVGACAAPLSAQELALAEAEGADRAGARLTDRVWIRTDAGPDLPGPMQVFLSDGTLVTDSCWETYRLSEWKQVDKHNLLWNEDGVEIGARIVSISAGELVLELDVGGGTEQRFVAAQAPFVCPDMAG